MEIELWRQVPNKPTYEISSIGRAKRDNEVIPIKRDSSRNYIHCGGKQNMNRLVALLFVPNDDPTNKIKIVNIDGNKYNNKASNLRWEIEPTKKNRIYKTEMDKPIIQYDTNNNFIKEWKNIDTIVKAHNYSVGNIYKCLNGREKRAYGYIWKYKEYEYKEIVFEPDEEFKNIGIFENVDCSPYELSNYGKVRHVNSRFLLKENNNTTHHIISLYIGKKIHVFQIHKLVAHVFILKKSDDHNIIIHKDDNLLNNSVKNLECITKKEFIIKESLKSLYNDELEIWLPVYNNEEYLVSTLGRIKSLYTNQILTPNKNGSYDRLNLVPTEIITQRKFRIHRIVAQSFIYNPDSINNKIVDHIDNDKRNNTLDNLRWITYFGNSQSYHQNFKQPVYKPIIQYDKNMNIIKEWYNIHEICETMNYSGTNIRSCINGQYQYAYNCIWRYKNESDNHKYNIELKEDEIFLNIGIIEGKDFSNYEISNYGNVKSLVKNLYIKLYSSEGYYSIGLTDKTDQKRYTMKVHRLVAYKFIEGKTEQNNIVNHLDEDKLNNKPENLEWTTSRGNVIHSRGVKINQICIETGKILNTFDSIASARETLNLKSDISIRKCLQGEYTHGYGYKWTYA